MIPKAEWYWASKSEKVYKFENGGKISLLDDAFSKILELTGNWKLAVNWQLATAAKWQKQEKKEKRKKKAEKSKEIG